MGDFFDSLCGLWLIGFNIGGFVSQINCLLRFRVQFYWVVMVLFDVKYSRDNCFFLLY